MEKLPKYLVGLSEIHSFFLFWVQYPFFFSFSFFSSLAILFFIFWFNFVLQLKIEMILPSKFLLKIDENSRQYSYKIDTCPYT